MLATDAAKLISEAGAKSPGIVFGKEMIGGKEFDSSKPEEYLKTLRKS